MAVERLTAGLGGQLDCFYFAFGEDDVYLIADLPDNIAAASAALVVNSSGAVTTKTVVLLTPAEVDEATKRSAEFRPPGA